MRDSRTVILTSTRVNVVTERITAWIVAVYQFLAILTFIAVPFLARQWLKKPFIGALVESPVVINTTSPSKAGTWAFHDLGLEWGYQVMAIDDHEIRTIDQFNQTLAGYQVGDTIALRVRSVEGEVSTYSITLQAFPVGDQVTFFYIPYIIALIYLATSLYVFGLRRRDATGKTFAVFATSVALALVTLFDSSTTNKLAYVWTFALAVSAGAMFNLGLIFPEEDKSVIRFPALRWIGYIPSLILILNAFPKLYDYNRQSAYAVAWQWEYLYIGISFLVLMGWMVYRRGRSSSPIVREQTKFILWGSVISFLPIVIWFFLQAAVLGISFTPWLLLFIIIFPLTIGYTLARYRLLQTDFIISQFMLYGTLTFAAAVGYALLVSGMTLLFGTALQINNPYLIGAIVFLLAFAFSPLRERIQQAVNVVFGRGQALYRERLQAFTRELTQAMELSEILNRLREHVTEILHPYHMHVFIHDPLVDQYIAAPNESGISTSDLLFSIHNSLVTVLTQQNGSLFLGELKTLPAALQSEKTRLGLLGSQLFVPLPGRKKLAGWIALGLRRSGEPYTSRDLTYLESLCDQAALAIERAQVVLDLERRIHAMNVLARLSQGINVTLAFDDILELIYAQTNNVIPTRDFLITLFDSLTGIIYHVFYLENDERLPERENQPIPINQGLEREVVKNRRAIVASDYERECRSRGTIPLLRGMYSWIAVPLNTGAETIGAISLGSRDSSVIFTEDQANLLQAIADQAAGAIVKARLLEEAERRTRQLTTLNEVARSMSSTLELKPLLNQILKSAVEILNCDAGSLLLVDQETGDSVFEVVVGPPSSANLVGQRLPQGAGLVGKAIASKEAIIVNDVRRTKDWSEKQDAQTGFKTNDMLVVPMVFKDQVTGVVEVLNRLDGMPFTQDDQELLTAFTSQAAIALENARLYTQTDQSLAARVEELSVMQRIDRELNASLDVNRAMHLTLDWAMRQSRAIAGLVGMIEEKGLLIMASQGYTQELNAFPDNVLPISLPAIKSSIDTGQPQFVHIDGKDENAQQAILTNAQDQLVVPIRRENAVIGVLLLETSESGSYPEDILAFLSRLSDHASIAIVNARLYAEVQEANQAKSDFVSFVSHELKTPMTSIRGFADLLAAGVVGPINENQSNFLSTIRSNVERMATLVSDLADVSRIEAGRLRLDFAPIPASNIVDEVVRSTRRQIEEKEQTLEVLIPEDLPPLWGDRMRLIQVVTNLVSNANKYTQAKGHIIIKAELVENRWKESPPKVIHFSVRDNGFGITPENQKKIFQKFYRADDQKVRDAPGTGLGLNITKQLVELQGGIIWFESEFRVGTTFQFIMPIAETA